MASKTISIGGRAFEISAPYEEGHTINAAEAKVLNQTRAENIGNNFRKQVKDAGEDEAKLQAILQELTAYDQKYTFSTGGGLVRQPVDPVEREARKIAREGIKLKLQAEGRKIKDVDPEKLEAAIDRVAVQDDVLKLAKKRVADMKRNTTDVSLGELGLGSSPAQAQAAE